MPNPERTQLHQVIDRRLSGKNKSIGNRERFLHRHKEQIREAVKRAVDGRGIRDIAQGEDIHIPKKDISEPVFGHGAGNRRTGNAVGRSHVPIAGVCGRRNVGTPHAPHAPEPPPPTKPRQKPRHPPWRLA